MKKLITLLALSLVFTMALMAQTEYSNLIYRSDSVLGFNNTTKVFEFIARRVPPTSGQSGKFLGTNGSLLQWITLSKSDVGLSNVDNTSDANKPVSTATQTALNGKSNTGHSHAIADVTNLQSDLNAKLAITGNGSQLTGLTKSQVGLSNVDNTSDLSKPISTSTQTAINGKQDVLISGTNIKTVNNQSLVGSGNIVVSGGSGPSFINLDANFSSSSTTPGVVTGWSFAVTSGVVYRVEVIADFQTAATTTGGIIGISLTNSATGSVRGFARGAVVNTAAATELSVPIRATSGAGSNLTTTGVTAANSPHFVHLLVTFTCTASGTFNIVWGSEVNASAAQLNSGSSLIYQALN